MAWTSITKTNDLNTIRKYFKSFRYLSQDILREAYLDTPPQFLEKKLGNSIYLHTAEEYEPHTFPKFRIKMSLDGYLYSAYIPDAHNQLSFEKEVTIDNAYFNRDYQKTKVLTCKKIGAFFGTSTVIYMSRDTVNDKKGISWTPYFNAFTQLTFRGIDDNDNIVDLGPLIVDSIDVTYLRSRGVVNPQSGVATQTSYFFGTIPTAGGVSYGTDCPLSDGEILIALPKGCSVFANTEDLDSWLKYGIDDGDFTKEEVKPTPETVSHYIFSNTKIGDSLDTSTFTNLSGMNRCNFKIKPDAKIVGYVNKNYPYNVHVKISEGGLVESNEQIDGGEFSPWSSSFTNDKWTYKEVVYNGNADKYYIGQPFGITFPIYATESQADGYLGGTTSITDSLYDGQNGNWNAPQNQTGERYAETNFNVDN
ncbi:MAG: hypothetical protein Q4E99_02610, partial [Bacillota bacterium]|nr:hypothetical protein [Bacillota bacterium]